MIPRTLAACLLVCALAGAALAAPAEFAAMQIIPYESPKPAPPLALPDLDGKVARLQDFQGKVLLVFFWATW